MNELGSSIVLGASLMGFFWLVAIPVAIFFNLLFPDDHVYEDSND